MNTLGTVQTGFAETKIRRANERQEQVRVKMELSSEYVVFEGPKRYHLGEIKGAGSTESGLRLNSIIWRVYPTLLGSGRGAARKQFLSVRIWPRS